MGLLAYRQSEQAEINGFLQKQRIRKHNEADMCLYSLPLDPSDERFGLPTGSSRFSRRAGLLAPCPGGMHGGAVDAVVPDARLRHEAAKHSAGISQ